MAAYLIEQGSFDAHSFNDDGELIYNEKKDKRFHFHLAVNSPEYIHNKKVYEATKAELAKQSRGLNNELTYDEKTLRKAWTGFEANRVKEHIVELYSSLDESSCKGS
jgi:hypothetical protein